MKRISLLILLILLGVSFSWGGDVATYQNLGFSENSQYFMFAQYGIDEENRKPFADTYIVDVYSNDFIRDGVKHGSYDIDLQPGQTGLGALFTLLRENGFIDRYKINHTQIGRVVYLLVNGAEPKNRLEFRDFFKGDSYIVTLVQQQFNDSASFHINLSVTDTAGNTRAYTVGLPNYRRKDVRQYRIKQVVFSPDERSLIFVVEKEIATDEGISIRYMVETVKIR
ncbi:MAG: DUF2259 domain-containing protein [Spirochaetales bacterium]|jgi:predicted secreted protein|nr:DUF2259 domain-containing protein [Spirochaetales bacterium]